MTPIDEMTSEDLERLGYEVEYRLVGSGGGEVRRTGLESIDSLDEAFEAAERLFQDGLEVTVQLRMCGPWLPAEKGER